MIEEALRVFGCKLKEEGEAFLLDEYIPAGGTYVIIEQREGKFFIRQPMVIRYDKKSGEINGMTHMDYDRIKYFDYNSRLTDMNKPMDTSKIIHSNNYLSFFVKKDSLRNGKLTETIIDEYYMTLREPQKKYEKKAKSKRMFQWAEQVLEPINYVHLEQAEDWVKKHIFSLDALGESISIEGKDYLKLFFVFGENWEEVRAEYANEGKRYLLPNIYNNNDFNMETQTEVLGVPNNNMALNGKKPFMEHRTRGVMVPYLLNMEQVMLQKKFFDYLYNQAAQNKLNVYIDCMENEMKAFADGTFPKGTINGLLLRLKKGKEAEIHLAEQVSGYSAVLEKPFLYQNYLQFMDDKDSNPPKYKKYKKMESIQELLHNVLFSKKLMNNYFTEASKLSVSDPVLKQCILLARSAVYRWIATGNVQGVQGVLDKVSLILVKNSLNRGAGFQARHQFNLRLSIKNYFMEGEVSMEKSMETVKDKIREKINQDITGEIETDEEFYFAVGQAVKYLLSQSKTANKTHALVTPFLQERTIEGLREKLKRTIKKYNYQIAFNGKRFNNLCAMIFQYECKTELVDEDMLLAGYFNSSLIFEKEEN